MPNIEKKCPYCGQDYEDNTIRVPGVYWGHYYDETKPHNVQRPVPPDILYHYTPFSKLKDMLNPESESFSLWAGHYSDMNDWEEVKIGIKLLLSLVRFYTRTEDKIRLYTQIDEIRSKKKDCFIFSLTEEKDILSQWRAYTSPKDGGVALGFDKTKLNLENIALVPCSYTNRDRRIDLNNILQMAKYRVSNKGRQAIEIQKREDDRLTEFLLSRKGKLSPVEYQLEDLIEVATTIKDFGFFEEKEWRLIVWNPEGYYPRSSNKVKIPFNPQTWIKEIVISPHGNKKKEIQEYVDRLIEKGVLAQNCTISSSKIPYRVKPDKQQTTGEKHYA